MFLNAQMQRKYLYFSLYDRSLLGGKYKVVGVSN